MLILENINPIIFISEKIISIPVENSDIYKLTDKWSLVITKLAATPLEASLGTCVKRKDKSTLLFQF